MTILGHMSRANPQWRSFGEQEVLLIFQGAHTYISPRWYSHVNVPTWNYMMVHLYGKMRVVEGDELYSLLSRLVQKHEVHTSYSLEGLPQDFVRREMNLHMDTRYSDGSGLHKDIAAAAFNAGVVVVIVTDHNILVNGFEGYYKEKNKKILMLIGEEVHDQARDPQKNHLLVFGANREMATFAENPQNLINQVRDSGGLAFLAHPDDPEAKAFKETDISWEDWSVQNYTGIELWNALSELKTIVPTKLHGAFYALFPALVAHQPIPNTLLKWDELLSYGRPVVAIGGSDAHALLMNLGPIYRVIFPYEFHFRTVKFCRDDCL